MSGSEPSNIVRKRVNDLVMAEVFLLQATIESANVIGDGISTLSKQIAANDDAPENEKVSLADTLQRIADQAVEPYTTRFKFFREMISSND
ncbi:MAG: hypothetical protein AB8C02_10555 [Halioglobus sp.]